ncbi:MAG: TonB family protein [Deltaproteobacteria bacterium]|nr:TonB family protein [Deltaproteobacteria bacterium]
MRSLTPALLVSATLHVGAGVLGVALWRGRFPDERRVELRDLEVDLVEREAPAGSRPLAPPKRPPLVPQLGDPGERLRSGPADSLAEASRAGAVGGRGTPRPAPTPLVGDDLDDLRFRPANHWDRDTPQRIRTARAAVSHDNRRTTPNPAEALHVLSGTGRALERPERARRRKLAQPRAAATMGASSGARGDGASPARPAGERLAAAGGEVRAGRPSAGVSQRGGGSERGPSGLTRLAEDGQPPAAFRRPDLPKAVPGVQTRFRMRNVADQRNRSLSSTQRIPDRADLARAHGTGRASGQGLGTPAGRAGDPQGARRGVALWLNTADRRYLDYFQSIYRKVHPLWHFPRELEIALEQGDVLVQFTLQADGRVQGLELRRSSGFPAFDRVVLAAIQRAAPFRPIPRGLGQRLTILAPFEFSNPLVR